MQTSHASGNTLEDFQFEVNPETAELVVEKELVQSTTFGNRLRVVANFSAKDYSDPNVTVPARTAVIEDGEHTVTYKAPAQ